MKSNSPLTSHLSLWSQIYRLTTMQCTGNLYFYQQCKWSLTGGMLKLVSYLTAGVKSSGDCAKFSTHTGLWQQQQHPCKERKRNYYGSWIKVPLQRFDWVTHQSITIQTTYMHVLLRWELEIIGWINFILWLIEWMNDKTEEMVVVEVVESGIWQTLDIEV